MAVIHDEHNFYYGLTDDIFKSVLFSEVTELTKWFLSRLLGFNITTCELKNVELPKSKSVERKKIVDSYVTINGYIDLNIEINSTYKKWYQYRNDTYACRLYSNMPSKGRDYKSKKRFIQYNICCELPEYLYTDEIEPCYWVKYRKSKDKIYRYVQNFEIFTINVDKIMEHWYNYDTDIDKYCHIIMLKLGDQDLKKLAHCPYLSDDNRKYVEEFRKKVVTMNYGSWKDAYISPEMRLQMEINTEKAYAREEGIAVGVEQNKIENAKGLLKEGLSPEVIARSIKMPIKQVIKIKKTLTNI